MKNIALYYGATIQLDAISMDSSLHTSADDQFFRDDVALNLCAVVDQTVEAWSSPSMCPQILTVPLPLILPTIVMLELIEEISSADLSGSEAATAVRCNCWTSEGTRSFWVRLSLGFPSMCHSPSFLQVWLTFELIRWCVNAVETPPKRLSTSRPVHHAVSTDLPPTQRQHLAVPLAVVSADRYRQ